MIDVIAAGLESKIGSVRYSKLHTAPKIRLELSESNPSIQGTWLLLRSNGSGQCLVFLPKWR